MILASLVLLTALVYTGIYLYRYLLTYESLLNIPKEVGFNFFLTIAPAYLVAFIISIILLSREAEHYPERDYALKADFLNDQQDHVESPQYDLNAISHPVPEQKNDIVEEEPASQDLPDYMNSLIQEVGYSSENKYELSIVLLNIEPKADFTDFDRFKKRITSHFQDSAFIFEYERDYTMMIVLPFYSFDEIKKELVDLFGTMREDLNRRGVLFRAGFTSKFSRYIDAETMLNECESAFEQVTGEHQSAILGFEPDIDRYEQYYSG
jgi:hypothetical protein